MRLYIYLFIVVLGAAGFITIFSQTPDPAAASRRAFTQVCEGSDVVTAYSRSPDRTAMMCACIAAWHSRGVGPDAVPFFPTQLYVLKGGDIGAGLSAKVLDTDVRARSACLK